MPRLAKPKAQGTTAEDLKKKLDVGATVTEEKKTRGRKPAATPSAPVTDEKVTPITRGKKGKDVQAVATTAPANPPAPKGKASPKAKVVIDDDADSSVAQEKVVPWEKLFPATIEGTKFSYIRQDNGLSLAELQKHMSKFDVHVLMAEQRKQDDKFTNLVLCFVSKESVTLIDQTGGEDFDSIVQVSHEDFIGKREFKVKNSTFPFAVYLKEKK